MCKQLSKKKNLTDIIYISRDMVQKKKYPVYADCLSEYRYYFLLYFFYRIDKQFGLFETCSFYVRVFYLRQFPPFLLVFTFNSYSSRAKVYCPEYSVQVQCITSLYNLLLLYYVVILMNCATITCCSLFEYHHVRVYSPRQR